MAPRSGLRRNAMACVALPTCGLALAESERYLPDLLDALDARLAAHGLSADDIVIRMTGCPNGCARPYLAEIGLVGKGRAATISISARRSTARAFPSSMPRTSITQSSSRARSAFCGLCRRAQGRRAFRRLRHSRRLRRAPERPAIFTPMSERSGWHERARVHRLR